MIESKRTRHLDGAIMERIQLLIFCLMAFAGGAFAQISETFDIATFQPPAGWKKQNKEGALIYNTSNEQKGTYAMIVLYGSDKSSGSPKNDFNSDWQRFIVRQLAIENTPEIEPSKSVDGWEIVIGGTAFKNEQGNSAVILNTFSGYGKMFSLAAIFNNQDDLPAIETFISSVKLKKSQINEQQAPANNNDNASILGTWGISMSVPYRTGTEGTAGSTIRQYTFNANGTYVFYVKTFRYSYDKLLLTKENGTYQISGNNLAISPQKSVIEAWSKKDRTDKWGELLTTQNKALEKVTYQFTKQYFSGIQQWSLVLQASAVTQRDGPYSGGSAVSNAWIYSPPCNQCLIELPR
jgi:hypothetical protein